MRRRFAGLIAVLSVATLAAADWPRFRGVNGMGVADAVPLPTTWSGTDNVAWKTALPGTGNGSPIVARGKVYVQASSVDASQRMLICLDAKTGAIDWTAARPGGKAHAHSKNSLASSTPAADADRLYAVFWDGREVALTAYDFAGKPLWAKTLGGYVSQHGVGMSPVAFGGKVYVNYDQDGAAEFVCFDGKSGDKLWAAPRKPFRACYSSALVREVGGKVEVIDASSAGVTAYDPETGSVRWNWVWKFDGQVLRTVGSPVLVGDTLVAVSGDGGGSRSTVALKLGEQPTLLWEKRKETPYVPGPLVKGDHIYWVTDGGLATCAELATGKIVWSERALSAAVSASPILAGDNVIAVAEDGKAVVFKATPKGFEKVAENALGEAVFASPAAADGKLYLRGSKHLFALGTK